MEWSDFGTRFAGKIGIGELMDDLGAAMASDRPPLMLGGGNPSHIPAVQDLFIRRMKEILDRPGEFERIVGHYDTPQGSGRFIEALADLFRREFAWDVGPANIALTNGSQNSFFYLWLWFEGLPVSSHELYERLKARGVLVVPGHYFFPGVQEPWRHREECIRVTYAQDDGVVERGLSIVADEVRRLYAGQFERRRAGEVQDEDTAANGQR